MALACQIIPAWLILADPGIVGIRGRRRLRRVDDRLRARPPRGVGVARGGGQPIAAQHVQGLLGAAQRLHHPPGLDLSDELLQVDDMLVFLRQQRVELFGMPLGILQRPLLLGQQAAQALSDGHLLAQLHVDDMQLGTQLGAQRLPLALQQLNMLLVRQQLLVVDVDAADREADNWLRMSSTSARRSVFSFQSSQKRRS